MKAGIPLRPDPFRPYPGAGTGGPYPRTAPPSTAPAPWNADPAPPPVKADAWRPPGFLSDGTRAYSICCFSPFPPGRFPFPVHIFAASPWPAAPTPLPGRGFPLPGKKFPPLPVKHIVPAACVFLRICYNRRKSGQRTARRGPEADRPPAARADHRATI